MLAVFGLGFSGCVRYRLQTRPGLDDGIHVEVDEQAHPFGLIALNGETLVCKSLSSRRTRKIRMENDDDDNNNNNNNNNNNSNNFSTSC